MFNFQLQFSLSLIILCITLIISIDNSSQIESSSSLLVKEDDIMCGPNEKGSNNKSCRETNEEDIEKDLINGIPISYLDEIYKMKNINDFEEKYCVTNVTNLSLRGDFTLKRKAAILLIENPVCQTDPRIVPLKLPQAPKNSFYFPTVVRVHRCDGGCSDIKECGPTSADEIEYTVNLYNYKINGRKSIVKNGSTKVQVVNHTLCECQCKVKEEHCDDSIHYYDESKCRCTCKNYTQKYQDCLTKLTTDSNRYKLDDKACGCVCRNPPVCSTNSVLDTDTCECVKSVRNGFDQQSPLGQGNEYEVVDDTRQPSSIVGNQNHNLKPINSRPRPIKPSEFPQNQYNYYNN